MLVGPDTFEGCCESLRSSVLTSYDLETEGLDPYSGQRLCGVALRTQDRQGQAKSFYVPFRHKQGRNFPQQAFHDLIDAINRSSAAVIGFNLPFDLSFTWMEHTAIGRPTYDVMVAAHLVNENESSFALKQLGEKYRIPGADVPEHELFETLAHNGYKDKGDLHRLDAVDVAPYAVQDVELTQALLTKLIPTLKKEHTYHLWLATGAYTEALAAMMFHGVLVDQDHCRRLLDEANEKVEDLTLDIQRLTGQPYFNPGSSVQVCKYLGLKSTNKVALRHVEDPLVPLLKQFRAWKHARDAYYRPYLTLLKPDGRIHCRLNQIGTVSGRLSASQPNMQGLAKENEQFHVRDIITAGPGKSLLSLDYSQIELRFLAAYTKSPFLIKVYREGLDLHQETADLIGVERDFAKRTNFGMTYGIGKVALAEMLDISEKEADAILKRYHGRVPEIRKLYDWCEQTATNRRYIEMWTGRRRHYGELDAYEKGMSNLIQGGVGEVMRIAITRLHDFLRGTNTSMILQIHDDIVFEGPDEELRQLAPGIQEIMEDFTGARHPLFEQVPIKAEAKIGTTWGRLHKIESPIPA